MLITRICHCLFSRKMSLKMSPSIINLNDAITGVAVFLTNQSEMVSSLEKLTLKTDMKTDIQKNLCSVCFLSRNSKVSFLARLETPIYVIFILCSHFFFVFFPVFLFLHWIMLVPFSYIGDNTWACRN